MIVHTTAGILVCLDGFMNIALEQTEEWVDGVLRNKFGDCFVRGNNGETNSGRNGELVSVVHLKLWSTFSCDFSFGCSYVRERT